MAMIKIEVFNGSRLNAHRFVTEIMTAAILLQVVRQTFDAETTIEYLGDRAEVYLEPKSTDPKKKNDKRTFTKEATQLDEPEATAEKHVHDQYARQQAQSDKLRFAEGALKAEVLSKMTEGVKRRIAPDHDILTTTSMSLKEIMHAFIDKYGELQHEDIAQLEATAKAWNTSISVLLSFFFFGSVLLHSRTASPP